MDELTTPFCCAASGNRYTAILGMVGPKYGFVAFVSDEVRSESPELSDAYFRQRLDDILRTPQPLPPAPHAEVSARARRRSISSTEISSYGFTCPSCGNPDPNACPNCTKYFCGGGSRDSRQRFQCPWCGETLIRTSAHPSTQTVESQLRVEVEETRAELRYRELNPGP
jgi:hypothetical protein